MFIANTLKCRPPGNRDPLPGEIANCQDYLFRQLELIQPKVVCTLGNFATKLLRGEPGTGITRLHGRDEIRVIGPRAVRLYPLYHPAAALYTRRCSRSSARIPRPHPDLPGARAAAPAGARGRRARGGRTEALVEEVAREELPGGEQPARSSRAAPGGRRGGWPRARRS